MIRKTAAGVTLIALCLAAAAPTAHADLNIVQNPGFEYGDAAGGPPTAAEQAAGVVYAWDRTGAGDHSGYGDMPRSGVESLLFGSSNGSDAVFSQVLTTVPNDTYQVSFWLQSSGGVPNDFTASFGGTPLLSLSNIAAQPYTQYTYTETATSDSTPLTFSGQNAPASLRLDDVAVTDASAAPEPPTSGVLGLIALTLGGLLLRSRKTQSQALSLRACE